MDWYTVTVKHLARFFNYLWERKCTGRSLSRRCRSTSTALGDHCRCHRRWRFSCRSGFRGRICHFVGQCVGHSQRCRHRPWGMRLTATDRSGCRRRIVAFQLLRMENFRNFKTIIEFQIIFNLCLPCQCLRCPLSSHVSDKPRFLWPIPAFGTSCPWAREAT